MNSISAIQSLHLFPSQSHSQFLLPLQKPHHFQTYPSARTRTTLLLSAHNPLHHRPIPSSSSSSNGQQHHDDDEEGLYESASSTMEIRAAAAAASIGLALYLLFVDEHSSKAMALGPEGPLMEEFWDNVRRYALYALTVSTGALYTILLPIWELLKNPISAILIVVIFVGGFYVLSQVVSAMIGLTEFDYSYAY